MKTSTFDSANTLCPHCAGTGLCQTGTIISNHSHQWLECEECGKGIPTVVGADFDDATHRPVCAQCAGKGVVRSPGRSTVLAHS
jgi:hypothetical protein